MLQHRWLFSFDNTFLYAYDVPLRYKNRTALSLELPAGETALTFGFEEGVFINEENEDAYKKAGAYFDGAYFSSRVYAVWEVPIANVGSYGVLSYKPALSLSVRYTYGGRDLSASGRSPGPILAFNHRIGFGRIEWRGSYQNGIEAYIENNNAFDFHNGSADRAWDVDYTIFLALHKQITSYLGFSAKARFYHAFFDDRAPAALAAPAGLTDSLSALPARTIGGLLRGIADKDLFIRNGGFVFSLNLDLPFAVLNFLPSKWSGNRKLHFLDFDIHLSPFIDMVMFDGYTVSGGAVPEPVEFFSNSPTFAAGLELLVYPKTLHSLYLRLSIGYNVNRMIETGIVPVYDEIFIGFLFRTPEGSSLPPP
jgi:hypothetical protein